MKFYKILVVFFLFLSTFTIVYADIENEDLTEYSQINEAIIQTSSTIEDIPSINSKSAVVIDRSTQTILYGKSENEKRKMASTTKIMTAIIVLENTNIYNTIDVSRSAAGTGGSRLGLKTGDKITVCDLLYGLLLCSGNDAAVALAEYVGGNLESFASMMNLKAKQLNLNNTHFVTPHGLDSESHYTTAYELALLTNYALQNKTFCNFVSTKSYTVTINGSPKTITNTNELLGNLNGVYGVKTGFTNGANRCLVTSCKRDNLDIICVVLGADTKKDRMQDSIKLIQYCYKTYQTVNLKQLVCDEFEIWYKNNINTIKIIKGKSNNLELNLSNFPSENFPINKDFINKIDININCSTQLKAPILKNTRTGTLTIFVNNQEIQSFDIINSQDLMAKNIFDFFYDFIYNYKNYLCKSIDNPI